MKTQIFFDDHEGFQRTALYWTVAAAATAILSLFVRTVAGFGTETIAQFLLAFIGMGIGGTAGFMTGRYMSIVLGASLGAVLGLGAASLGAVGSFGFAAPLVGVAVAGAVLGTLWGPDAAPRFARAVGFALAAVVGLYVARVLFLSDASPNFLTLPGIMEAGTGAVMGLFVSLGSSVGRFRTDIDPVRQLWREKGESIKGDMHELTERGVELYEEILVRVEKRRAQAGDSPVLDDTRRIAGGTTGRLIQLAARWCEIEGSVEATARPRLEARLKALDEKLAAVKDSVVRAEYAAAATSLREQLTSFERINVARERLIARVHRCTTSLEQVSMMLLQLSTSDAQQSSLHLQPELERLDEMSEEFNWKSLTVDDLMESDLTTGEEVVTSEQASDESSQSAAAPEQASERRDADQVNDEPEEVVEEVKTAEVPAD